MTLNTLLKNGYKFSLISDILVTSDAREFGNQIQSPSSLFEENKFHKFSQDGLVRKIEVFSDRLAVAWNGSLLHAHSLWNSIDNSSSSIGVDSDVLGPDWLRERFSREDSEKLGYIFSHTLPMKEQKNNRVAWGGGFN